MYTPKQNVIRTISFRLDDDDRDAYLKAAVELAKNNAAIETYDKESQVYRDVLVYNENPYRGLNDTLLKEYNAAKNELDAMKLAWDLTVDTFVRE